MNFHSERPTPRAVYALALALTCLPPASALAQANSPAPVRAAAVDAAVRAEMERQGVVGAAVGIIQNGEIVYLKGYGLADRERRLPVTTQSIFNWASNSKPLAAVAAMQLVAANQLDLDADVRRYVPEFPAKDAVITARQILCHQSGIPHYANGKIVPNLRRHKTPQPYMDPVLALDTFSGSPLLYEPGEKTSYSSYAYILLSAVVQRAGDAPFADQVRDRIAKPLGLDSLTLDVEDTEQQHWAAGYVKDEAGDVVRAKPEANYWKHGAGGYKSNIGDFSRWAQALINRRLVPAVIERQMWTPQPLTDGTATTWGLGFVVEDQGGLKVSHNGKQNETTTRLVFYPRAKHGIVVMSNCGFGDMGKLSTTVYSALNGK